VTKSSKLGSPRNVLHSCYASRTIFLAAPEFALEAILRKISGKSHVFRMSRSLMPPTTSLIGDMWVKRTSLHEATSANFLVYSVLRRIKKIGGEDPCSRMNRWSYLAIIKSSRSAVRAVKNRYDPLSSIFGFSSIKVAELNSLDSEVSDILGFKSLRGGREETR
jgi:hypothetical protein